MTPSFTAAFQGHSAIEITECIRASALRALPLAFEKVRRAGRAEQSSFEASSAEASWRRNGGPNAAADLYTLQRRYAMLRALSEGRPNVTAADSPGFAGCWVDKDEFFGLVRSFGDFLAE